ncbi:peptidase domain-containing ABC transporter [Aeromonas hydrophila]|uniref:peptidase domain-containing ABC transporter n=1 Tax=Aeromonas hydrophila TaxID=644 RepID=UPI0005382495|nr:type I secretion system permease/ATPase [Aeromonas hydrophila]PNO61685.1 type I secretion system permease/ATPase [Aeromonas hydrophila]
MCDDESVIKSASRCSEIILELSGVHYNVHKNIFIDTIDTMLKSLSKEIDGHLSLSKLKEKNISSSDLPLAYRQSNGGFIVLAKISDDQALIQRPSERTPDIISRETLKNEWTGDVIIYKRNRSKFGLSWFVPEFARYRRLLGEVLIFSFFIQMLSLALPLFFQIIIDKVLVHNATSTLDVLVISLICAGLLEVLLKGLREYLLAHTTTRIDIRLGAKLYKHLLCVPILYFKAHHVGTIVARVRELDSIRNLLSGAALTLLVDVLFIIISLGVMFHLSTPLMLLVITTFPLYGLIAWASSEPLKSKIEHQFSCGAKNTAFLTESINGVEALKSLALEPGFKNKWERQCQELVKANFSRQNFQNMINQSITLLQKVTSVVVLWVGAQMVMSLELTIGQLIAFNMMVNHVIQPVAKLVEIWQQFIQTRVAVDNLGEIINLPTERELTSNSSEIPFQGHIQLKNVWFRYQPHLTPALKNFSIDILPGESIGFVGPSGSGKSTVTRIIQKLYLAENGQVIIDGISINEWSAATLRENIGVVLQENYLFHRTVRENIAIRIPSASLKQVVDAAKLAGAHEFIIKMPKGYDTLLSEGGSSLSGGQRQRIAIARALMTKPRILIFDEATSALDEESQSIVNSNMAEIAKGRTVIIVAHRLSAVQNCNRIVVIEQGEVTEIGSHDELLKRRGCYERLWKIQQSVKFVNDESEVTI